MAQSVRHVVPWTSETSSDYLWPIRLLVSIAAIYGISKAARYLARLYQLEGRSSGGGGTATARTGGAERHPPDHAAAAAAAGELGDNKLGHITVIALQIILIVHQTVLLYRASGTMETLIAIRVTLLYLLLLISIVFTMGAAAESEPSVEITISLASHIITTLQTYLLPGMWDRMEEGLPDRLYIVYTVWYAVFVWGGLSIPLFVFLTDEGKTSETGRDSRGRGNDEDRRQEHLAGQRNTQKRRHCAIAIGYLLMDLAMSVFLNYKCLKRKR